jgi:hypothetical protein
MSGPDDATTAGEDESTHREYVLDVRIVECDSRDDGEPRYRFEAPQHRGETFDDLELAELYADIYFDVNGFEEAGTGERGVPPEIIQAGRDTLAAYFLTQPGTDENWVASFFGVTVEKVQQYVAWVENRSEEVRRGAEERGIA